MARHALMVPLVKCLQAYEVGQWRYVCCRALTMPPYARRVVRPGEGGPLPEVIHVCHVGVVELGGLLRFEKNLF